jgi:RimJ/RimL family protein N-acetyltransferase
MLGDGFVERALRKGDSCYAVRDAEKLIAFSWYSNKPTEINGALKLLFDPKWIYLYHGFTREEFRGQRLLGIGMAKAADAFIRRGFKGVICYVEANNASSLKALARVGFRDVGTLRVVRLLGRHIIRRDAACRAHAFDLRPADLEEPVPSYAEDEGALV